MMTESHPTLKTTIVEVTVQHTDDFDTSQLLDELDTWMNRDIRETPGVETAYYEIDHLNEIFPEPVDAPNVPERIIATYQPQYWQNDQLHDAGPAEYWDVTELVLAMGDARRAAIEDYSTSSDALVHPYTSHDGPRYVVVRSQIDGYFERH